MTDSLGKVIIAGGSGFLGQTLTSSLVEDGYEVVILGRGDKKDLVGKFVKWDAKNLGDWSRELEGATALFNLTGRSVDCRYTKENKALILNSRVDSTKVLGEAIRSCDKPPCVWLNASTATIYNDRRGDLPPHDEQSEGNAEGFSEEVGRAWEKVFFDATVKGVRQVAMRISIVLGEGGGAFPVMRRLTKLGLGGKQGPGTQWISWLHIDDWVGIAKFLLNNSEISGPVNLAAQSSNKSRVYESFTGFIRSHENRSSFTSLDAFWSSSFGNSSRIGLKSRKVISRVLSENDFRLGSQIEEAIRSME